MNKIKMLVARMLGLYREFPLHTFFGECRLGLWYYSRYRAEQVYQEIVRAAATNGGFLILPPGATLTRAKPNEAR